MVFKGSSTTQVNIVNYSIIKVQIPQVSPVDNTTMKTTSSSSSGAVPNRKAVVNRRLKAR